MSAGDWINVFIAIGTIGAVVVALFGDWIRSRIFPPSLTLALASRHGEKVDPTFIPLADGGVRRSASRWYHVRVSNPSRRIAPAHNVQLILTGVAVPDAARAFVPQWIGAVPMKVRYLGADLKGSTVGPAIDYDLCSVTRALEAGAQPLLQIHSAIEPNQVQFRAQGAYDVELTFQARSIEVDSAPLVIRIAWNGQWSDDEAEMARNFVISDGQSG